MRKATPATPTPAAPAPAGGMMIELPPLQISTIVVRIVGDSPLISHAWSKKAIDQMLAKQMKKAAAGREEKNPFRDFCDSLYWLTEKPDNPTEADVKAARFGFPSIAFKAAAVDACTQLTGVTKVMMRGAFHIEGEMVEIEGTPESRQDMVRIGMGVADIRYRGEFKAWSANLTIRYNTQTLSAAQIVNLINVSGFAVGVGEWRPAKDGIFGMYHVATEKDSQ